MAHQHKKRPSASGLRGVFLDHKKWIARITVNYQVIPLGRFASKEDAAAAYREAAQQYFGEFAGSVL